MTTDDTNEITPSTLGETNYRRKQRQLSTFNNTQGMTPIALDYVRKIMDSIASDDMPTSSAAFQVLKYRAEDLAKSYLAKCEEVERCINVNHQWVTEIQELRVENQLLQAELSTISKANAEEVLRLQGIIDRQREITGKLFIDFAKSIENIANSILERHTLTRIKLPDEEVGYWIDHIKALALTGKEGE